MPEPEELSGSFKEVRKLGILTWIIFGFIAGSMANFLDPNPSNGGIFGSIILGIIGAMVGGWLGENIFGVTVTGFNLSSFVIAVAGALILLLAGRVFRRA